MRRAALLVLALLAGCVSEPTWRWDSNTTIRLDEPRRVALSWGPQQGDRLDILATDAPADPDHPVPWPFNWTTAQIAGNQLIRNRCKIGPLYPPQREDMIARSFVLHYSDCRDNSLSPDQVAADKPVLEDIRDRRDVVTSWLRNTPHSIDLEAYDLDRAPSDPPLAPLLFVQARMAAQRLVKRECRHEPTEIAPETFMSWRHFAFRYYCGDPSKDDPTDKWEFHLF